MITPNEANRRFQRNIESEIIFLSKEIDDYIIDDYGALAHDEPVFVNLDLLVRYQQSNKRPKVDKEMYETNKQAIFDRLKNMYQEAGWIAAIIIVDKNYENEDDKIDDAGMSFFPMSMPK